MPTWAPCAGRTDLRGANGRSRTDHCLGVGQQVGAQCRDPGCVGRRQTSGVAAHAAALTHKGNVPTLEGYLEPW